MPFLHSQGLDSFEHVDVGSILLASRLALHVDEMIDRHDRKSKRTAGEDPFGSIGVFEWNRRTEEDIDFLVWNFGVQEREGDEVFLGDPRRAFLLVEQVGGRYREAGAIAGVLESRHQPRHVVAAEIDDEIQVRRHARGTVEVHRERAHDEISNLVRLKRRKDILIKHGRTIAVADRTRQP